MKQLILTLFSLIITSTIYAQTEKGNLTLSGGTGLQFLNSAIETEYDGKSQGDYTQNTISFTPSIGYFVIDNLELGIAAAFSSTTTKDQSDKYITRSTTILPGATYYFPAEGNIRPVLNFGVGLMSQSEELKEGRNSEEYTFNGLAVGLGAGVACFLNNHISLNFGVAYLNATLKDSNDSKSVQKKSNIGGSIGFSVYL